VKIQKLLILLLVFGCQIHVHAQQGGVDDDEILQLLDTDYNQTVSFDEIDQGAQRIRSMDANGDKQVSVAEMAAARGVDGGAELAKQLMGFDKNKDGKLSADEVPHRMRLILKSADKDKDGLVDRAELAAMTAEVAASAPPAGRRRGGRDDDDEINPTRMVQLAMSFDADSNGQLNRQELTKFAEAFAQRGGSGRPRAERPE
jgi:Ca2+-binding EF-hand superfamily protein